MEFDEADAPAGHVGVVVGHVMRAVLLHPPVHVPHHPWPPLCPDMRQLSTAFFLCVWREERDV